MPELKKPGDAKFTKILEKLKEMHKEFPSMSFGTMIQNALDFGKRSHNVNLLDVSSKEILKFLEEYNENIKRNKK